MVLQPKTKGHKSKCFDTTRLRDLAPYQVQHIPFFKDRSWLKTQVKLSNRNVHDQGYIKVIRGEQDMNVASFNNNLQQYSSFCFCQHHGT